MQKVSNITKLNIVKRAIEIIQKRNKGLAYSDVRRKLLSSKICEKLFEENSLWEEGPLCLAIMYEKEMNIK
ncbi:MAG: hypothetical protein MJ244_02685 [Clostridia bacterium]|nr:hypothetical protein [Clostridia bacterium]